MQSRLNPTTLQKRPTTPGKSPPSSKENSPPVPDINTQTKEKEKKEKRSSLAFLRRSRSNDTARGRNAPPVPNIPLQAPRLPDLWVPANGSSQPLKPVSGNNQVRDSVDIVSGMLGIPGMSKRSIDTAVSGANSAPGGYYVPGRSSGKDSATSADENAGASMTHRGRYSFASTGSTANPLRRVRRRKDPTPFNILITGARNSGKTSFIQFLQQTFALPATGSSSKHHDLANPSHLDTHLEESTAVSAPPTAASVKSPFVKTYLETEIDGERIGLTLWDSAGFEPELVDLQLRETIAFIESKFEETFTEETKVVRSPGVRDTHIHCAFHLVDPARLEASIIRTATAGAAVARGCIVSGGLDEALDLQVLRALKGKTTVVPVISKADTITSAHMNVLKYLVRTSLKSQCLDPLDALEIDLEVYGINGPALPPPNVMVPEPTPSPPQSAGSGADEYIEEDDDEEVHHARIHRRIDSRATIDTTATGQEMGLNVEFLPLSILSPDGYEQGEPIGRRFPWGFADPYNAEHCDFLRLKDAVFSDWRGDLREASREIWYENWRTSRLSGGGIGVAVGMPACTGRRGGRR